LVPPVWLAGTEFRRVFLAVTEFSLAWRTGIFSRAIATEAFSRQPHLNN
jgi:hypothetical protein